MNKKKRKGVSPFNKILVAMVAILVIMGGAVWAKNTYFNSNKEAIASDSLTEEELKAAKADLTVDLDSEMLQAAYPEVSREFLYSSMPSENKARVAAAGFSTALTFPFSGASQKDDQSYSDEVIKGWWDTELTEELFRNEAYGIAMGQALSEVRFPDGSYLTDINPWLIEFNQKVNAAFQDGGLGNGYFLTKETADGPILVTDEYRRYAIGMRWLLDRFIVKGVSRLYAEKHWGLRPANDLQPSRVKAEAFEEPEDRDALVVSFLTKSGKNVLVIGFNVHDKRPEIPGSRPKPVPEETPQETTPQETPQETKPEPTKPGRDPEPTTPAPTKPGRDPEPTKPHRDPDPKPTKPGKDPDPTKPTPEPTTPAPTPETKKERSKDSVNNGGGRVGGGSTVIGTDSYEPNDPITETGKGHGDPAKETPATPTQDQSHQDVKVDHVDQNKMNYETIPETQSSWKTDQGQNLITGTQGAAGSGSGNSGNTGNSGNSSAGNSGTATEGTPLTGYGEEFHLED